MVVTISKRAPWNLGKQMLQIFPEPCEKCGLAVKDDYSFGFLELGEKHRERELERAIVKNIERFLREIGNYYSFIGSQYRIEVDKREFFCGPSAFSPQIEVPCGF